MSAGANPVRQVAVSARTPAPSGPNGAVARPDLASPRARPVPCTPSGALAMTENTGLKRTARAILLFLMKIGEICGNELARINSSSSVTYGRFLEQVHSRLRTLRPRNSRAQPAYCETRLYKRMRKPNHTGQTRGSAGCCTIAVPESGGRTQITQIHEAVMSHGINKICRFRKKRAEKRARPAARMCHGIIEIGQKFGKNTRTKTSTSLSWNVPWNQQDNQKPGARPKAGMSFGIIKIGATSKMGRVSFFGQNVLQIDKNRHVAS